jgi:hypothetical protein
MSLIDRVVRIVFKGDDQASGVAQSLWQKLKSLRWADIAGAFYVVKNAVGAVTGAMADLFASADALDNSLRKLEGTSRITGTPLDELQKIAAHAKREFGLGTVNANEYSIAVANLATKAGFAGDKQQLLAAMLDLGAAKGLTAAESLVAFQQSILGIDEGTDKLFGKNPSGLWADYAEQVGKAPGKMSDLDKSLVLVMATMDAGAKVTGSYGDFLDTAQGRQAQLTERVTEAKAAFGVALSPLREFGIEVMSALAGNAGEAGGTLRIFALATVDLARALSPLLLLVVKLADILVSSLAVGLRFVMLDIRRFATETTSRFGSVAVAIGGFVEKSGALLKKFGIDVVQETGTAIREWGETQRDTSQNALLGIRGELQEFERDAKATARRLFGGVREAAEAEIPPATQTMRDLGATGTAALESVGTGAKAARQVIETHLGGSLKDLIGVTTGTLQTMGEVAERSLQPTPAAQFAAAMGPIVQRAHEVRDRINDWGPKVEDATGKANNLAGEVAAIARAGIEAGQAFGVLDAEAASLLNSVTTVAASLPKALGGDLTALGGVIGGVANIAKQVVGGDPQRQKNLRENSRNLDRLTREVSGLRLGVTGEQYAGVGGALGAISGMLGKGFAFGVGGTDRLRDELGKRGLNFTDLEAVAKALGINIRDGKGNLDPELLQQLLQAIGMDGPTQIGNSFSDKLDQLLKGFDVRGTGGMAQLSGLFGLGTSSGASILDGIFNPSDLAGTRAGLLGIFDALERGEIDPSQIGGLTGAQFRDLIIDLIGRVDDLMVAPDTPSSAPPPGTAPTGEDPLLGGDIPLPTGDVVTLAEVFRGFAGESVPLLTQQLEAQLRIADATEATAAHTADTVAVLLRVAAAIEGGALAEQVDRSLGRARAFESLSQGVPFSG